MAKPCICLPFQRFWPLFHEELHHGKIEDFANGSGMTAIIQSLITFNRFLIYFNITSAKALRLLTSVPSSTRIALSL